MPMPLTLVRHLTKQITVEACTAVDRSGLRTFAAAKTLVCRVQQDVRRVTDHYGREVVSSTAVYTREVYTDGTAVAIAPADRITLPAGYAPQQPPIIHVSPKDHDPGRYGWVIRL